MSQKIAFITYETPYSPAGGVAAVMARLPAALKKATNLPILVISPYHYRLSKTVALADQLKKMGTISVPFENLSIKVNILKNENEVSWVFLQPTDGQFFSGARHPYDVGENQEETSTIMLRDALFFGVAAAEALPVIDPSAEWILLLQDWEAATIVLSLEGIRSGSLPEVAGRRYLVLHNSYDSGAGAADLMRFHINPANVPGDTVLLRSLPNVEDMIFTVSDQFAIDLVTEILQTEVLAPHLQAILPGRLLGINNGLFADLALDREILERAERGDFDPLQQWKETNRRKAVEALGAFVSSEDRLAWGDLDRIRLDEAPWFILAGRDDPRQKGYDIASLAIDQFLDQGGEARFLFFPIPGDEGLAGLEFLKTLAGGHPEEVLVLPFLFKEGYFAALQGAAFGVMPSLYEPFGMANEFYLNGAVGIGRATGGIIQQIVPLRAAGSFSKAAQARADRWHALSARPTGLLYREPDGIPGASEDWQEINAAEYELGGRKPGRAEARRSLALVQAMVAELTFALDDAVNLYRNDRSLYFNMLLDGIRYLQSNFSWDRAARSYARHILKGQFL